MVRPERSDMHHPQFSLPAAPPAAPTLPWVPAAATDRDYRLGGHVGHMQADLARRLGRRAIELPVVASREEQLVRFLSVAAGYSALVAGYAGIAFLILR